jgi:RNA polymerase sigma-70 factor (ECF subfamily)
MSVESAAPSPRVRVPPVADPPTVAPARSIADISDEDSRLQTSLNAARAGNVTAFEAIYRALNPRLSRYARGLVGQDADDVAAEAWLQIVRDLENFEGDWDAFRGWAARILRNRAIDHLRAAARRPMRAASVDALIERASADDTAGAVEESLSTAAAIDLIATLPPDQAEAVLLRAVMGLDAKSAAAVLGKRAGAVRVAAHRGLKTLAKRVDAGLTRGASNGGRPGAAVKLS